MASRFWVGGTGTWDNSSTTHWSATTGGGAGASNPSASDDVIFDTNSGGGTVTISGSTTCQSLDSSTAAAFTMSWNNAAGNLIIIGSASGGKCNIGATVTVSGITTVSSTALSFVSTTTNGGVGWPITTSGIGMPPMNFNGLGGKWQFQDNVTWTQPTTSILLSQGTLDTNGKTLSGYIFSLSGSGVRSFIYTNSSISLSRASTAWDLTTSTNYTQTATGSTITLTGANGGFIAGTTALTYGNVTFTGGGICTLTAGITNQVFNNVTFTGTASKTDGLNINSNITVNGTFNATGQSVTNRILVANGTIGSPRTITAAAISLTNADFMDITGAGLAANAAWTGTSLGDCLGNSNITFDTPAAQTWSGNTTGNWSTSGNWTSRVPLPQDNANITGLTSGTITIDMPRMGANIDFTSSTGGTINYSTTSQFFGSSTFVSNLIVSGAANVTAAGRSSLTITCAGKSFPQTFSTSAPNGTYTFSDNFSVTGSLLLNYGTLTASANVTCTAFSTNTVASTRAVNMGTGVWKLTGTGKIWDTFKAGLTFTPGTATMVINDATSATKNIVLANDSSAISYPTISYINSGTGTLSIENAAGAAATTINNLNIGPGRAVTFGITGSWIINNPNMKGVPNGYVYLPGVASNYASTPDSAALSITGDIDMRVRVAMDDWTPTTGQDIFSKWGTSPQQGFDFHLFTNGKLRLYLSSTGSNQSSVDSSVAPTISDGSILWIRATWRASDGRVQFFTADGSIVTPVVGDFTQLGTDQTIALASIFDNTAALEVGSERSGLVQAQGKFYRAQLRNGLDGTLVYDANFATKTFGANSFTESSAQAATVTINGTLAQAGDGRVLINTPTPGSAASFTKASGRTTGLDYVTLQDNNASGGAAFYAGVNSVSISNVSGWIFKTARTLGANTFRTQGGTRTQAGTRTTAGARTYIN